MAHRTGMRLGFGLGGSLGISGSEHEPARFFHDSIAVNDYMRQIVFKTQRESIVILERTLANITELIHQDSLVMTDGEIIARRIVGRSLADIVEVNDIITQLRENVRMQSDNAVVTDNVVVN